MTTPLISSEESDLPWQTITNRNIQNRANQNLTDRVTVPAEQNGYEVFYETINNIRQSSRIATEGQLAADTTRRARIAAEAAAARERARDAALAEATKRRGEIASGGTFGQPDFNTYPLSGYPEGQGPSSTWKNRDEAAVADLMRAAGFREEDISQGLGIAFGESGFNALASHENTSGRWAGSVDRGLFQINDVIHAGRIGARDIYDPFVNVVIAKEIFDEAGGWTPWNVFGTPQGAPRPVPAPRSVVVPPFPSNTGATGLRMTILDKAQTYIGMPYVWGGESIAEGGFDCSGLVYRAYADAGINISRVTANQYATGGGRINGVRTTLDKLQPGDLVAWDHNRAGESPNFVGHIAIYAGNGEIIEARGNGIPVHRVKISQYDHLIGIKITLPGD